MCLFVSFARTESHGRWSFVVSLLSSIMLVRFLNIVILTTHSRLIGKGFRYVALRCPMSLSARTPTFLLGMRPGVQWLGHHVYVRSGFVDTRGGFPQRLYDQHCGRFSAAPCSHQHLRFPFSSRPFRWVHSDAVLGAAHNLHAVGLFGG